MAMASLQSIYTKIVDLIVRRVVFLFLLGTVLSLVLIDQDKLKIKTLNTTLPSASVLKEFVYHPAGMDQGNMRDMFVYYHFLCDYMGSNTYEKPAACGIVGYAYYYLGDEKKAIDYFLMATKLFDHSFWPYYDLGVIYFNKERYDQAMKYFALARDAYPYTIGFFLRTMTYQQIAGLLGLNQDEFQKGLQEGGSNIQKLYIICKLFVENPDLKKQFMRKKIDLRLF
ncbi:MAG: tetratricopeptide repeat protein [Candidatus Omnitrophica bacterium]|nr:tetratricopeptide repeat protein [Candidatus Omnitrophota bacterium]